MRVPFALVLAHVKAAAAEVGGESPVGKLAEGKADRALRAYESRMIDRALRNADDASRRALLERLIDPPPPNAMPHTSSLAARGQSRPAMNCAQDCHTTGPIPAHSRPSSRPPMPEKSEPMVRLCRNWTTAPLAARIFIVVSSDPPRSFCMIAGTVLSQIHQLARRRAYRLRCLRTSECTTSAAVTGLPLAVCA